MSANWRFWRHGGLFILLFLLSIDILGDRLLGPVLLPNRLTDSKHSDWSFQHDGSPVHSSIAIRGHLHGTFGQRGVGRGGPVSSLAKSPDLNHLDFFWEYLKTLMYATSVNDLEYQQYWVEQGCYQIGCTVAAVKWRGFTLNISFHFLTLLFVHKLHCLFLCLYIIKSGVNATSRPPQSLWNMFFNTLYVTQFF